ncbi:hypothetical protein [Marinobacter sp. CA1]|uniref:hypothetical protein n=1 Tax=Marinobacter sp. CA1 TaxID=2817656 RepID=UPI001D090893|nr:hypothetical protein [Marinobacter sp. CA1]MCG8520366.1 hypothetical protein [Pseudomonadales bacterium]UDL04923.1 hypothetical protein J2887_20050 [Marinobacter sp. CA1]
MTDTEPQREGQSLSMMYGTYADVLFVLFPFLIIFMQRIWDGDVAQVLLRPDLSIAAAILGGLAIGKFVLGLVTERELGRFKERIVFFIALTLFVVMGPAIILMLSIISGQPVPGFVAFLQPVLLIVAISLYTTAISISNMLTKSAAPTLPDGTVPTNGNEPGDPLAGVPDPEPLNIPRRSETP